MRWSQLLLSVGTQAIKDRKFPGQNCTSRVRVRVRDRASRLGYASGLGLRARVRARSTIVTVVNSIITTTFPENPNNCGKINLQSHCFT